MDLEWQILMDSSNIEKIAYEGSNLCIVFRSSPRIYIYHNVPINIYTAIMNKACCDATGKPSHGATLDKLVKKAGYDFTIS